MRETAAEHLAGGASGIWRQALNGVPVKLYARAAADAGLPAGPLAAAHPRSPRHARRRVRAAVAAGARDGRRVLERAYGPYLGLSVATYPTGLAAVVHRWRRRP